MFKHQDAAQPVIHMTDPINTRELFQAFLQRQPTEDEAAYWDDEILRHPIEEVFRRFAASAEHRRLSDERRWFENQQKLMFVPAGHFYSPIVDQQFVSSRWDSLYRQAATEQNIDLNESTQILFLDDIKKTAKILPFAEHKADNLRYHYENGAFLYGDGITYAAMLQKYRPKRIVEIGAGFSSALALDVIDRMPDYRPDIRFIDPYPQLAHELVGSNPNANVSIEETFIQDVDPASFDNLEADDFYFMDTTHIIKTGSDVLYHFEKVLPRLKSGVILHLHDIFYPFEYPSSFVFDVKLSWNELYYFRAFMVNNSEYEVLFFNSFMTHKHLKLMTEACPLFEKNGGASIWLRKK